MSRAAGAADAVDIGHFVIGHLVVDDVGDIVDIDTASRDIGCDQDVDVAIAERRQRALTCRLAHIAVDGGDQEAALAELLSNRGGAALRASKNDGATTIVGLQDAGNDRDLIHLVRLENNLFSGLVDCGLFLA